MDQKTREFSAQVLGTIAHKAGKDCIPALDPELTKLYNPGLGNAHIIRAWINGWTLANLYTCYCCGKGDATLQPCQCGELLCQDCKDIHICEEMIK